MITGPATGTFDEQSQEILRILREAEQELMHHKRIEARYEHEEGFGIMSPEMAALRLKHYTAINEMKKAIAEMKTIPLRVGRWDSL
jgi:hypothetical protein